MKKRIVFCNHFARQGWIDGAEVSLFQMMTALPSDSYEKFLVSPATGELTSMADRQGIEVFIAPLSLMWTMGNLVDISTTPYKSLSEHLSYLLTTENTGFFRLKHFLRTVKPDLLLVNTSVNVLPAVAGRRVGAKIIWFPREYLRGNLNETGEIFNKYSDRILVASGAMEQLLKKIRLIKNQVYKLPNFININNLEEPNWPVFREMIRRKYHLKPDQIAVCYWGSISPKKGIDDFLQLARSLYSKYGSRVKFFVIGCAIKQGYLSSVTARAKELGLGKAIFFPGFFPLPQQILPGMDLMVLPSRFTESFSRAALDGLTFRKPVVAYDGGGISDLVKNNSNGYLVPKASLSSLTAKCSRLIENRFLRENFGINGRRLVDRNFSAPVVLPQLEKVFDI